MALEDEYPPELRQSILDSISEGIEEDRQKAQSQVTGQAISSGFGYGGTSQEGVRRAQVDRRSLDQYLSAVTNQAQQYETMRVQEADQKRQQSFDTDQNTLNQNTQRQLEQQGIQTNIDLRNSQNANDARMNRQDAAAGAIGAGAGLFGSYLGGKVNTGSTPYNANPKLNLYQPGANPFSQKFNWEE